MIDWGEQMRNTRQPTKKEKARFNQWVKYLKDSKLSIDEIYYRAAFYTEHGTKLPDDYY